MKSTIHWFHTFKQGRLGTMAYPAGGDELENEVAGLKAAGVAAVISALTNEEIQELSLALEPEACESAGIEFFHFPIVDHGVPEDPIKWESMIQRLSKVVLGGKPMVIHCRKGIGRSSMIAMGVLVASGVNLNDALEHVIAARRQIVPETAEQLEWLVEFARSRGQVI